MAMGRAGDDDAVVVSPYWTTNKPEIFERIL
jgi:hypothetical protein